jgi:uncharacterized protein YeaO (DUF488 family)
VLYTTYFSKMNKIPDHCIKFIITRFPPKWLNISKYPGTFIVKALSPSQTLLLEYKQNNDWDWYMEEFKKEMQGMNMMATLKQLEEALRVGKDICLICYEKDYTRCHRSILGQYFQNKGFQWKEL